MQNYSMSSTSTIFQSLDSLSLYLEIRKYQELLAKQKELYHSNQDGTILLKEPRELIQLRNSLEEAIFATSRFGVDPTNPEELEAWFQKHQSYLDNMGPEEYQYFMKLRAQCLPLDGFFDLEKEEKAHAAGPKKVKTNKIS